MECLSQVKLNAMSYRLHYDSISFVAAVIYCYAEYTLKLSSTAPAIEGVNVTFFADLYQSGGVRPINETYSWVSERFLSYSQ